VEPTSLDRKLKDRHAALKADVQIALAQSARGESAPLDMDAIKRELIDELDEQGRDK